MSGATSLRLDIVPGRERVTREGLHARPAHLRLSEYPIPALSALEEQRSEKYRQALIAVVSIGVRAGQLGGTDAWLSSHLVSHA